MKKFIFISILLFFTGLTTNKAAAQDSLDYEQKRAEIAERQLAARSQIENLEEQIETYTERLGYATNRFDQMFRQYEELERVIALQQEQIRQMTHEQQQIREEIMLIQSNLNELEQDLIRLIQQYKQTLTYLYKNGRTTELVLLFTSTSFNQLLIRSYYLKKFDEHRQIQADEIEAKQKQLETNKADLEELEQKNEAALASIQQETENLEEKRHLQERNIELLRRDRNNLQNQLENFQKQRDDLENALSDLIEEEEAIRRETGVASSPLREGGSRVTNNELAAYETDFENQRGNLPWPVDNGTITEKFGVRTHPVFRTQTNNPGIDIATTPRSSVKAVADGYVFGIQPFSGFGEVILVNHGTYKTAYGNLSNIYVRKNQVLRQGDIIGQSGDENSIRGEVLFFLVREGNQFVNPEIWLRSAVQ